ncbi:cystatin-M [Rousettus aegyptiacus]|uniref:Cystatin E/M n=1 Tax=Rousettus aegyptiacus TaxID=9407 RepID=A0A7J8GXL1_ROUAE|nr:cystatin-M [Rousettus aegyptiacus]KAF6464668.1 cystatin E/M [Rousettus aegyptiacus]
MAQANLQLVLGLALLAICLLALPRDAGARPQERMVGGLQDLSPSDPQVQKAAQSAVASYNMGSNSLYYFRDTHILKAQRQLVAGVKYYLTVEMGSTACRKNAVTGDHIDLTTCPLAAGTEEEKLHCDFEILVIPWQNSTRLLKHHCVPV